MRARKSCCRSTVALFALAGLTAWSGTAVAQTFTIDRAEWSTSDGGRLRVEGNGIDGRTVTIRNAGSNAVLGTPTVDENEWDHRSSLTTLGGQVPCTVSAQMSGSTTVLTRAVSNRPSNCGPVAGAQPSIRINDVTVTEGAAANFTISLSAASSQTVTVVASTGNGTAAAPGDFTARSNVTVTFPAGSTSQTFAVTTIDDTTVDGTENFTVNLTSPTNATIADAQGIGTITDNDVAPPPANATFSINDVTVTEGGTANFTVTRAGNTTTAVSVVASTADATALAPGDFTARANVTLSFAANVTTQTFAVTTINDTTVEVTENFTVNLTSPSAGATITDAQGIGTITDNDVAPPTACSPAANINNVNGSHVGCFTNLAGAREYTGPAQCVACHEQEARNMHNSVHYQQNGPTDFVTNIAGDAGEGPAGKPSGVNAVIGINTYCGTHQNSPRFTCAGCHVGNGRFPKTEQEFAALSLTNQRAELANIDCLMCHQQVYKRFPDWTATGLGFEDLVLQNVREQINPTTGQLELAESAGSTVTRSGFQGIPIVGGAGDFQFRPAGAPGSVIPLPAGIPAAFGAMPMTTEEAAEKLHRTTRQSCLNCHAGAAGANGAKRGDLSTANWNSTDLNLDRHMARATAGGSDMTCSTCHNVDDTPTVNDTGRPSTHRVRGRGLDLRANDHATRFTCDNAGCHNAATVHNAVSGTGLMTPARLTRHTNKVACQTCHIPRYGKAVATEIARDWQNPHVTQTACNGRGGWLPNEIKSSPEGQPVVPVTPSYQWFDGTSQVYYLTESLANTPTKPLPADIATQFNMPTGTPAYIMGRPNGTANVAAAKIYPMKEHWGKLARDTANNTLIPHSTFEFFRTGSFCRAVAVSLGQNPDTACIGRDTNGDNIADGAPTGAAIVPVHTYQTINHGVEPQANSLGAAGACGSCHSVNGMTGGPVRMDLKGQLGYRVRTTIGWTVNASGTSTCANSCHSSKSASFTSFHERSQHTSAGCNACHDQITGR